MGFYGFCIYRYIYIVIYIIKDDKMKFLEKELNL